MDSSNRPIPHHGSSRTSTPQIRGDSMKRICKYCGNTYEGDPGSSACPECVAKNKKTTIRERTCSVCGAKFMAGPSSKFCPSCLAIRKREQAERRKRTGTARPLGSTDKCLVCGQEYIVTGGKQKYCPECAEQAIRENDRKKSREWNAVNTTPEQRKATRKAASAEIPCAVCGKLFVPTDPSVTCSPECRKIYQKRSSAKYESENKEYRKEYQRNRIRKKEAAMSPEEYKAYRDRINARARENRKKREAKW